MYFRSKTFPLSAVQEAKLLISFDQWRVEYRVYFHMAGIPAKVREGKKT